MRPTPPRLNAANLDHNGVRHGFFGRAGGVSMGIYASLNTGPGSDDDADAVNQNRARCASALGVAPERLLTAHQVHGDDAVVVDGPWDGERPRVDALVTQRPGLAVGALAADCMPVLFIEPSAGIAAAAHAGWRGALAGVLEATVETIVGLGGDAARIHAALGPCLRRDNFEVGLDLVAAFVEKDPSSEEFFHPAANRALADEKRQFDCAGFARHRLAAAGVHQFEDLAICTLANPDAYFSHRASKRRREPDYGRNLSAIALVEP